MASWFFSKDERLQKAKWKTYANGEQALFWEEKHTWNNGALFETVLKSVSKLDS